MATKRLYTPGTDTVATTIAVLDVPFQVQVPATVEIFDLATGVENSCLTLANNNHGYRGFATAARSACANALAEAYPDMPWEKKTVTAAKYAASVIEAKPEAVQVLMKLDFTNLFMETLENYSQRNTGTFSQEVVKLGEQLRGRWEAGTSTPTTTAAGFAKLGVIWNDPSEDVTDEVLLPLLKQYIAAQKAAAAAAL